MQTLLQTKQTRLTNSQRITKMLHWDELQYATFIHETGLAYLRRYIPDDPYGAAILERSSIFWNWWKNHWTIRDQQFLDEMDMDSGHIVPRALYEIYHSSDTLADTIFPNAVVLGNSYAVMIGNAIKSAL